MDGVVTTTWPIEARRRAEEALLLSERRFSRAEEIAGLGHWELHLDTGIDPAFARGAGPLRPVRRRTPAGRRPGDPPARVPPPARPGPAGARGAGATVRSGVRDPPRRRRAAAGAPLGRRVRPGAADRLRHPARHHGPEADRGRPPVERGALPDARRGHARLLLHLPAGRHAHVRQHGPRGAGRAASGGARRAAVLRDDLAGRPRARARRAGRAHPGSAGRDPRAVRPMLRTAPLAGSSGRTGPSTARTGGSSGSRPSASISPISARPRRPSAGRTGR